MNAQAINAAIAASSELQALVAAGDFEAVATALSVDQPQVVAPGETFTVRGAAAKFPSLNGLPGALSFQLAYRKLTQFAAMASADEDLATNLLGDAITLQLDAFNRLGLDFGEPALRDMLDLIVASSQGTFTQDEAEGFKALGLHDAPKVSWVQVYAAVNE